MRQPIPRPLRAIETARVRRWRRSWPILPRPGRAAGRGVRRLRAFPATMPRLAPVRYRRPRRRTCPTPNSRRVVSTGSREPRACWTACACTIGNRAGKSQPPPLHSPRTTCTRWASRGPGAAWAGPAISRAPSQPSMPPSNASGWHAHHATQAAEQQEREKSPRCANNGRRRNGVPKRQGGHTGEQEFRAVLERAARKAARSVHRPTVPPKSRVSPQPPCRAPGGVVSWPRAVKS